MRIFVVAYIIYKGRIDTINILNILGIACMTETVLLLTTWPDEQSARQQAQNWLNAKLVACVNILPKMQSLYKWEGELQSGNEHQMLLKTSTRKVEALQQAIVEAHPYECPEILQLAVTGGYEPYLNWITGNTE